MSDYKLSGLVEAFVETSGMFAVIEITKPKIKYLGREVMFP